MNAPANVSHLSTYERPGSHSRAQNYGRAPAALAGDGFAAGAAPRKKFVAKGHDAQLQDAQFNQHPVEILTVSDVLLKGTIARRDKYTITLRLAHGADKGKDLIVYKHAIESVLIDRPAVAQE